MRLVCVSAHNRLWLHILNLHVKNATMIITSTAKTTTQHRPRMKDMRLFVWKKKMKNNSSSFWRVSARTTTTFSHRNRCECIYFVCVSSTFSYGRRLFIGFTQETPNVIYFVAHNALLILVYAIWKWISVAHKWSWEKNLYEIEKKIDEERQTNEITREKKKNWEFPLKTRRSWAVAPIDTRQKT